MHTGKKLLFLICIFEVLHAFFCKPNILLMVIDDLRINLGSYGYKSAVTPNIDRLASKSFVFKNAFCQQSLCAPSRNSFLTSRRPDSLHLYDFHSYWRESVGNFTTLPQHFKENGYYTFAIGKVFHWGVSSNFSDDMPYSWSKKAFHPKSKQYENDKICINRNKSLGRNLLCPVNVSDQPEGTLPDLESAQHALDFLKYKENITGGSPYLLAVGFHKPHIPFKFPVKYLDRHPIDNISLPINRWRSYYLPHVAWNPWIDIRKRDDVIKLNVPFPFGNIPDFFIKQMIQHYNAAVTYIDDLIGEILNKVEGTNTIVILTSDHGWSIGEHGEFAKYSNFDVSTRVPLMIHVPQLSTSQVIVEQLVELVDLFPTLVDITKVSSRIPRCDWKDNNKKLCTEGRTLLSVMLNSLQKVPYDGKSAVFSQYPRPNVFPTKFPNSDEPRLQDIKIMGYSIRTKIHRYTEWVSFNNSHFKPDWSKSYGVELYDHTVDPDESMNLIDRVDLKEIARNLRIKLILGWRYA